jgi:hypothetical protein
MSQNPHHSAAITNEKSLGEGTKREAENRGGASAISD